MLRALEKLPADRFGTAAEFAAALLVEPAPTVMVAATPAMRRMSRVLLASVGAAALTIGALGGWLASERPAGVNAANTLRPKRLTHDGRAGCAAIAPDGRQFAAVVGDFSDETQCGGALVVRPMPTGPDLELARVSQVTSLRWSPTGDALLLFGQLSGKAFGLWILPTRCGAPR